MNNSSTMFLSNLTILDHAIIDERGNVVGGSFNPSFFVTGRIDPAEQVVVDFSTVKKDIKNIIDHKETGFDHKLWWIQGISLGTTSTVGDRIIIVTPTTRLEMPTNAVRFIPTVEGADIIDTIQTCINKHVTKELRKLHPGGEIQVKGYCFTDAHFPTSNQCAAFFRYAHGLKDSTSWGCNNIAHGHLSYIQLLPTTASSVVLQKQIATDLHDTMFVFNENITDDFADELTVEYDTPLRGHFLAQFNKKDYNIIILETETTVEHLVEYVVAKYHNELTTLGVELVLVSEGLSKGACLTVSA